MNVNSKNQNKDAGIQWHNEKRKLSELIPYEKNPRKLSEKQYKDLKASISKFNLAEVPAINLNNIICAGHQRLKILKELHGPNYEIDVRVPNRLLTEEEYKEYNIRSNKNSGDWDFDILANNFEIDDLLTWGWDENELDINLWKPEIDEEKLDEVPEPQREAVSQLGDIFLIDGKHRVMCGDSTKKEDVEKLMDGKKADMVLTDPPYGMFLDTDFSSMKNNLKFMQEKGIMNGKKYDKVIGDNADFDPNLITTVFENFDYCKEIFLFGADYYSEYLPNKNAGSWVVWDKRLDESADKMYGSCFELVWSKSRHKRWIARIKWAGAFGTEKEPDHKRFHPNQKPVNLIKWFYDYYSLTNKRLIVDLYAGVGSVLIASEQTDRTCYTAEISPQYIDVILRRYKNLYTDCKIECLNREFDFKMLDKNE